MPERSRQNHLQPSLLDRLTDDAPGETIEKGNAWFIDVTRLREIIQRDLHWLLNTTDMGTALDTDAYPEAARSVLNFGVTDISGSSATVNRAGQIRQAIRTAIERFEPRLLPETLEVSMREDGAIRGAIVSYDIRAELWAEPVPLDLFLRTNLDMTTGEVTVRRQG